MVVLVMVCFIMGYFCGDLRDWAERRIQRRNWDSSTNLRGRSRSLTRGLDSSVIETFPTFLYSTFKGVKTGKATLECAICLNEFEDEETLRLIPRCSHLFHHDCIDAWLYAHSTCPVCRTDLVLKSNETITVTPIQGVTEVGV
ncbi:transcription factor bHLH96-like [Hibiscus syriacus]|uniref:RING-type E3 ubiquitin transferase n=1 Tax=Hibiscus syriacus TaxID=106335 RepID=A0A6A3B0X6_HIBSY|nr:RING-H2 finger protein ATL11-like [Hibiscus syriacus]KAE8709843.1 transcription factor bHLH96-like [Hibiscus syriacus]